MALDWQKIEVAFGAGGLGESTDPHQLPPARLVRAENVEIVQAGRFDKRRGVVSREASQPDTDTLIATPSHVLEVTEGDLAYHAGRQVGRIPRTQVTTSHVTSRQDVDVVTFDVTTYESDDARRVLYAYELGSSVIAELSAGVAIAIKDPVADAWVLRDFPIAGTDARHVRAITVGTEFLVFWTLPDGNGGSEIRMTRVDAVTGAASASVAIVADSVTTGVIAGAVYDVAPIDDETFALVFAAGAVAGFLQVRSVTGSLLASVGFGDEGIRSVAVTCQGDRLALAWDVDDQKGDDGIYTACLDLVSLSWTLAETKIGEASPVSAELAKYGCHRITVAWLSDTRWFVAWTTTDYPEDSGDRVYREPVIRTHTRAITTAGVLDGEQSLLHWVLASKAWTMAGRVYALLSIVRRADYDTDRVGDETNVALVELRRDRPPVLDAVFARDVGTYRDTVSPTTGGISAFIPHGALLGGAAHVPYLARRSPFDWVTTGSATPAWYRFVHYLETAEIRRLSRDALATDWRPQGDTMSGVTYLAGALPLQWDGSRVVEHAFSARPLIVSVSDDDTTELTDGGLAKGVYTYVVVYTWRNALGQTEFSAISLPYTVEVENADAKVKFHVRPLTLTYKSGFEAALFGASTVTIAVYRSFADDGSGVYHLVSRPHVFDSSADNRTIRNNPSVPFHVFTDALSDDQIASNPLLYTDGGVLENDGTGPVAQIITAKGRLWAIEADGRAVLYSKPVESHEIAGFSAAQRIPVETDEPLTAIGALADRIVAFTRTRAFVIFGDGPTKTGAGGLFTEPAEVPVPAGCIAPTAITRTPAGLVYVGPDGIYLMGAGGQVQDIGRDVADTMRDQGPFPVALHMPARKQVRFFSAAGDVVLVWDYEHGGTWTVHTYEERNLSPVALPARGTAPGELFAAVREPGVIVEESRDTCLDDDRWVPSVLETGHIQLDGIQGYQRVRDVSLLLSGRAAEGYALKVSLAADDGDWYGTATLDASDIGTARGVQGRVTVARQLCRSIRVRLEDEQTGEVTREAEPRFLGLAFQVGVLRGVTRLGTSAKRGVT